MLRARPGGRWGRIVALAAGVLAACVLVLAAAPSAAPWLALSLAAGAYAVAARRRHGGGGPLARWLGAALVVFLVPGLFLPALVGAVNACRYVVQVLGDEHHPELAVPFLAAAAVVAALVALARHWRWGEVAFVAGAVAAAALAKLLYVASVDVPAVSDFARMWELAGRVLVAGPAPPPEADPFLHYTYLGRILPYFLPARALFGPASPAYTVPNVVSGLVASLGSYLLARDWFGAAAARVTLVVSLLAVETWLAAAIPSHDVPGALFTVLALLAFVALRRRVGAGGRRTLPLALGAGVLVLLVQVQRTTGLLLLVTCAAVGLASLAVGAERLSGRRLARAAGLLLVVPWLVVLAGDLGLRLGGLRMPHRTASDQRGLVLAVAVDSWGSASPADYFEDYADRYGHLDVPWFRFAVVKLASDTRFTPAARLGWYLRKSRRLYDLGTQLWFYLDRAELAGGAPVPEPARRAVLLVSRSFSTAFLALLVAGGWRLRRLPGVPAVAVLPLVYLGLLSALLLAAGQIQPRYLYPIWYLGAIYVGLAVAPPGRGARKGSERGQEGAALAVLAHAGEGEGAAVGDAVDAGRQGA